MKYLRHFPGPVLTELIEGRWLPILGSGLSRNALVLDGRTMPLWEDLGKAVAKSVPDYSYMGALDALSAYEQAFDRRELVNRLHRELLVDEARPGSVHEAFSRLRFDRVVTTNLEFLLERGYDQAGERYDVVVSEDQLPIPPRENATVILKLHGDLRHPSRLVVTEDDYDGFLSRHPVLATHVSSLLIERVPIFIGYSLDDPDFRQLQAVLKDRLGKMLPTPYVVVVGASSAAVARYERRGVRVINLPGSVSKYGEILTQAFQELEEHWSNHVLDEVRFTQEPPLEQVRSAPTREKSRLCYFSIPLRLLPLYRDEIFPLAEQAGLVPVSAYDIEAAPGNRLAATRALVERSSHAVVDMSEGTGSVEFGMALQMIEQDNVLLVSSRDGTPSAVDSSLVVVFRPESLGENRAFFHALAGWFQERGHRYDAGFEADGLLRHGEWSAALVAAVAELELVLQRFGGSDDGVARSSGWGRPTLRQRILDPELPIDDQARERLLHWIAIRNGVVHQGARVSEDEAQQAVGEIKALRSALG